MRGEDLRSVVASADQLARFQRIEARPRARECVVGVPAIDDFAQVQRLVLSNRRRFRLVRDLQECEHVVDRAVGHLRR